MFYDKQSNNQVLRMQTMHTGMPISNEAEELKWVTLLLFFFEIGSMKIRADVSSVSSLRLYMLNRLLCSSSTNESVFPQKRVSVQEESFPSRLTCVALTARPLQAYFIINNRIYQSPDMYTVLSNRLARRPSFWFDDD